MLVAQVGLIRPRCVHTASSGTDISKGADRTIKQCWDTPDLPMDGAKPATLKEELQVDRLRKLPLRRA